jgi:mannose-6-phosphate isomerase-like protein (cupin superfamily)
MIGLSSVVLFLSFVAAVPPDPPGVVLWKSSVLKGYETTLAARMDAMKLAVEQLGKFGNHSFMISHREASGEAEVHENQADVFIVEGGSATLVLGGVVEGGRTTAPGETRGKGIRGGEPKTLGVGDIVHIPASVPHQLLVAPGQKFTYFVIKIDVK